MNKIPKWKDANGVSHWEAEMSSCDTHQACHLQGEDVGIDCPMCLGGIVTNLYGQLMHARHALTMANPEGWECLEGCKYCS